MSYGPITRLPDPARELSRRAAIVGLGESDYHLDYRAERARAHGYQAPTMSALCARAFERALADSGLKREDIDGFSASFTFGGPEPGELASALGLRPRYCIANGNIMTGPLPVVCADIAAGKADTVAMIYCIAARSSGRQFGGASDVSGEGVPASYYYYHPWGWSSQAAHWALAFSHYQAKYGVTEEDLGSIAMQLRRSAMRNANAVMQEPMSLEDYLASRYIVRPLHLFDICMVNDGAVCLIVSGADKARDMPHAPVLVAGWGESHVTSNKMDTLVRKGLRPHMQEAGAQALGMAGLSLADVQHFECYDVASSHLVAQLEGHGFVEQGTGFEFCKSGEMAVGGKLPTNVWGGNLSGSYMQGWAHVAEVVRQLRHEAGERQIADVEISMSTLAQSDQVHPLVFVRGDRA